MIKLFVILFFQTLLYKTYATFEIQIENVGLVFDNSQDEEEKFLLNAINSAIQYFSEVLEVTHQALPTEVFNNNSCETKNDNQSFTEHTETDLIVILSNIVTAQKFNVIAETCNFGSNNRPVVINLVFNLNNIILSYQQWKNEDFAVDFYNILIRNIQHEMIHGLGLRTNFADKFFGYGSTSEVITQAVGNEIRGIETAEFITPKLIEKAEEFYGCDNISGLQLENSGGTNDDSVQSHWESTIIAQDIMTFSSIFQQKLISEITLGFLEDTGWYTSVDYSLSESMQWGKNKGCDFLEKSCFDVQRNYTEFQVEQRKCTYDYQSIGVQSGLYEQPFDGCQYMQVQQDCTVEYELSIQSEQKFGKNSRCIQSQVNLKAGPNYSEQFKCYSSSCIGNIAYIYIQNEEHRCIYNRQKINVDTVAYQGYFYCPDDLERFCAIKSKCPDHCSQNGYCLEGKCRCLEGYAGVNCQAKCTAGQLLEYGETSCSVLAQCPNEQYLDTSQLSQYTCLPCYQGCKQCTGSEFNQCTQCISGFTHNTDDNTCRINCTGDASNCSVCVKNSGYCIECQDSNNYISNGQCVESCEQGFYEDNISAIKQCLQCPPSLQCVRCSYNNGQGKVICDQCIDGFIQFNDECLEYCPYGYYQADQLCIQCHIDCGSCFGGNSNQCLSCKGSQKMYQNQCVDQCPINYKDKKGFGICEEDFCLIARKDGVCVSECSSDEYIRSIDRSCAPCDNVCAKCIDYPDKCIQCPNDNEFIVDFFCTTSLPSSSSGLVYKNQDADILKLYKLLLVVILIIFFTI